MKNRIVFFLLLGFAYVSCKDESTASLLEGCCDNPPLISTIGISNVYVPNIFTPNGDDHNDYLYIGGDSLAKIVLLEIRNQQGQTVYSLVNKEYDIFGLTWDGRVNGVVEKGLYNYILRLESVDGYVQTFTGSVCNYPCDVDTAGEEKISPEGCAFGIQNTSALYDPTIASGEQNGCFE